MATTGSISISQYVLKDFSGTDPVDESAGAEYRRIDGICQVMRWRICSLEYPFGHRLGETTLAEEFGVSRTPIRQALQRLQSEGLVEVRHGVGNIVIAGDPETMDDIYSLRLAFADLIASMPPSPVTPEAVEEVERLLVMVRKDGETFDAAAYLRVNARLHRIVNGLIGNPELAKLHDLYYFKVAPFWFRLARENIGVEVYELEMEVRETLAALRSGDVQAIANVNRNHVAYGMLRVKDRLQREEDTNAIASNEGS